MPLTRFSAKTEIGVIWSIRRNTRNVITIAKPPTSSGSSAATRPRKNQYDSRSSTGEASSSARASSLVVSSLSSWLIRATPPKRTLIPASFAFAGGLERATRTRPIAVVASVAREQRVRSGRRVVQDTLEPVLSRKQRREHRGAVPSSRIDVTCRDVGSVVAPAYHQHRHGVVL